MQARGLSGAKVARATGIAQSAISDMTTGKKTPYIHQAMLIAKRLNIPLDYLAEPADNREIEELDLEMEARKLILRIGWDQALARIIGQPSELETQTPPPTPKEQTRAKDRTVGLEDDDPPAEPGTLKSG